MDNRVGNVKSMCITYDICCLCAGFLVSVDSYMNLQVCIHSLIVIMSYYDSS